MGDAGGTSSEVGRALFDAVARVRALAADATAEVVVVTPSTVNGALARRELALAGSFIRVDFATPLEIVSGLAEAGLRGAGLVREPAGWMRATLLRRIRGGDLPGGFDDVLAEPGWMAALVSAVGTLEAGGALSDALRRVASQGTLPADLAARTEMLAVLLDAVRAARAKDGIAGPGEEVKAARRAIDENAPIPANVPAGAVLLGDARGSRLVSEVLTAWLARRPVVRVAPAAIAALPPAEHGLTLAAPHAEVIALPAHAPEVRFVRTPDPTREMLEAVREAQAAIARGVALDRIAIVLPDPSEATALADALSHAELPATWLTGRPLAEMPAARFLLHALELALGNESVLHWYELLRRPELRLRGVLGEPGARGRGRWRRLLATTGVGRGTKKLRAELERLCAEDGPEGETPDAKDARLGAIDALRLALDRLGETLTSLRVERPLGAHARALRDLVRAWWAPTQDQAILARLLEGWGRSVRGPSIDLEEMTATLREALESTETLSGGLKDPAIRVLSPMQLLGAELEVALVTGVTEGRFPRRPSEDPLLVDAIVDAIAREVPGAGLFRSGDRVDLERRRLASIRSAATGVLWLSSPRLEMLEGRPLAPGSVLLGLASELAGKRVLPSELSRSMTPVGRRSRAWPDDPERAVGPGEHLLARLHSPDEGTRTAALGALVLHTLARRIVVAERARDRILRGDVAPELRAHAGFVDPSVLACIGLDGTPLRPAELAKLLAEPEEFFLTRLLRAWKPKRLRDGWDPVAAWFVEEALLRESRTVLERGGSDLGDRLRAAVDASMAGELERAGETDAEARARLGRMAERAIESLVRVGPTPGPITPLDAAPIAADLPWRLCEGDARRAGTELEWIVKKVPGRDSFHHAVAELLEAAARRASGAVDGLRLIDVHGRERESKDPAGHVDDAVDAVRAAQPAIEAGYFPGKPDLETFARWPARPPAATDPSTAGAS